LRRLRGVLHVQPVTVDAGCCCCSDVEPARRVFWWRWWCWESKISYIRSIWSSSLDSTSAPSHTITAV